MSRLGFGDREFDAVADRDSRRVDGEVKHGTPREKRGAELVQKAQDDAVKFTRELLGAQRRRRRVTAAAAMAGCSG